MATFFISRSFRKQKAGADACTGPVHAIWLFFFSRRDARMAQTSPPSCPQGIPEVNATARARRAI